MSARDAGSGRVPRLLFVCVENACRSQMAEAFARRLGSGRVHAFSAGSRPSGRVHPRAVAAMAELGLDLTTHASKSLDDVAPRPGAKAVAPAPAAPEGFDVVVTMGCGDACPWVPAGRREDWELPDPKAMELDGFRTVRDEIGQRVRALLDSLS